MLLSPRARLILSSSPAHSTAEIIQFYFILCLFPFSKKVIENVCFTLCVSLISQWMGSGSLFAPLNDKMCYFVPIPTSKRTPTPAPWPEYWVPHSQLPRIGVLQRGIALCEDHPPPRVEWSDRDPRPRPLLPPPGPGCVVPELRSW